MDGFDRKMPLSPVCNLPQLSRGICYLFLFLNVEINFCQPNRKPSGYLSITRTKSYQLKKEYLEVSLSGG